MLTKEARTVTLGLSSRTGRLLTRQDAERLQTAVHPFGGQAIYISSSLLWVTYPNSIAEECQRSIREAVRAHELSLDLRREE